MFRTKLRLVFHLLLFTPLKVSTEQVPYRHRPFLPDESVEGKAFAESVLAFWNTSHAPKSLRHLVASHNRSVSSDRKKLQVVDLYGGIYNYAYYYISLLIGTPPQRQSVIVDSGSSLLGFPCRSCRNCGTSHIDDGFDLQASETARLLECGKDVCYAECGPSINGLSPCRYHQSYSEGSSIEGNYFSDLVALGEQQRNNPTTRYDYIGCHDHETNLFRTQKASGILGISFPKFGKQPTLIDAILDSPNVDQHILAICASEEGGLMTVGGYNSSYHILQSRTREAPTLRHLGEFLKLQHDVAKELASRVPVVFQESGLDDGGREFEVAEASAKELTRGVAEIAWTPVTSMTQYQIEIESLHAIEQQKSNDKTGVEIATKRDIGIGLVDSGTTFTYFAPKAFKKVIEVLRKSCQSRTSSFCSRTTDSLCWTIGIGGHSFKELPSFLFRLKGGAIVEWSAISYLHQKANSQTWCIALDENNSPTTILGLSFFKAKNVILDKRRGLIGFADANCPIVSDMDRPPPPTPLKIADGTIVPVVAKPSIPSFTIPVHQVTSEGFTLDTTRTIPVVAASLLTTTEVANGALDPKWSRVLVASSGVLAFGVVMFGVVVCCRDAVARRGREYRPMTVGGDDTSAQDLELGRLQPVSTTSVPIQTPTTAAATAAVPIADGTTPQSYDAIEAELDALERETRRVA